MSPKVRTRREPQERAVRTRAVILQAAAEVFDEFGFSGASISKIMKRAEVTQGAMYFHFGSKEELAHAVMIGQGVGLQLPDGEDGLQRLIDITIYLGRQLQTNPVLRGGVRLAVEQGEFGMRDDQPYQQWVDVFREQLRAARTRGELNEAADEDELAVVLVGAFSGTQLFSQVTTGRADLPELICTLWRYLLPAAASDEARGSFRLDPAAPGTCPAGSTPAR
ncbi:ScbR family autoregulator-binding transcription factor [Kitasatospora sp. NBC_01266]|uniref:ScbR family autoregulator-binding transcription factor n=1 Tax=Kitasatospora sp. NBC_01266 TaxID=2903572 RepID=UPI002E359172|nr:ScbR family autoregulator-binding transcription factor [Kitasatospora sp. NBC_01266]